MSERPPSSRDPSDIAGRPQDPFVAQRKPTPHDIPERSLVLNGLLGDSDRPGHRRLYFNKQLDYYAEFRIDDVLDTTSISPSESPFIGEDATRVTLQRAAIIEYTRVRAARPIDDFDLDVRLGPRPAAVGAIPAEVDITEIDTCATCAATEFTCLGKCVPETSPTWCGRRGSTCLEVCDATPFFCNTHNRATCGTCQGNTCQTCQTCQNTCRTCVTCQGQATCRTCETCGLCP